MIQPRLSTEESKELAKHIVAEMIARLANDEDVGQIARAWGKYLDQWLGKNLRRFLILVLIGVSGALAVKFEVWSRLFK